MKTLPILALVAASVALVIIPFSFEIAVSLLFAVGLAAIVVGDYQREIRPLTLKSSTVSSVGRTERLGLAA